MDELLRGATTSSSPPPTYRSSTVPTTTSQKLGANIPMTPRVSMSNQPPVDQNAIAVTAIAQNMINGKPVSLKGAHLTPIQVKKFVDNVRVQLRTSTFSNSAMETLIDEKAWRTINMRIKNSRTVRDYPALDYRTDSPVSGSFGRGIRSQRHRSIR